MQWILVRTYGNGSYMNKVYPMLFRYLSQAERLCLELNEQERTKDGYDEKWIPMPLVKYEGKVW